ncbi:hypothetical protein BDV09DRAFT_31732 [Aspergillus tetrazonus]
MVHQVSRAKRIDLGQILPSQCPLVVNQSYGAHAELRPFRITSYLFIVRTCDLISMWKHEGVWYSGVRMHKEARLNNVFPGPAVQLQNF